MLFILSDHACRNTANYSVFRNIFDNSGIRRDYDIISQCNIPHDLRARRNPHAVTNDRWIRIKCIANGNLLINPTITPDRTRSNIGRKSMLNK